MHQRAAADVLISGLSHIEIIAGGMARFVIYIDRIDPETKQGYREYPPAIVMAVEMIPDAIQKATAASTAHIAGRVTGLLPRWLH